MPTKTKPERSTEIPQKVQSISPGDMKEIVSRIVKEISQNILDNHPGIKVRGENKDE